MVKIKVLLSYDNTELGKEEEFVISNSEMSGDSCIDEFTSLIQQLFLSLGFQIKTIHAGFRDKIFEIKENFTDIVFDEDD